MSESLSKIDENLKLVNAHLRNTIEKHHVDILSSSNDITNKIKSLRRKDVRDKWIFTMGLILLFVGIFVLLFEKEDFVSLIVFITRMLSVCVNKTLILN